jgi:endo-1,3(4)-beta-glucanase
VERVANLEQELSSSSPSGENAFQTDIFNPISSNSPPDIFNWKPERWNPFIKKAGIRPSARPMQTNKFYGSLLTHEFRYDSIYTFPYSLTRTDCSQQVCGIGVSHVEERNGFNYNRMMTDNPYVYGSKFVYPIILSAEELRKDISITTDSHTAFSVSVSVAPAPDRTPVFRMPLLQGMAFITGIYSDATPVIGSNMALDDVTLEASNDTRPGTHKYSIGVQDGSVWLMYVTPDKRSTAPEFTWFDKTRIKGPTHFSGVIQFAKVNDVGEPEYDKSAGAYPTSAQISGSVDARHGKYTISWKREGAPDGSLLMFALPHHVASMDDATKASLTKIELITVTKGIARAILADKMTLVEAQLPTEIDFPPWPPDNRNHAISPAARDRILRVAKAEMLQDHSLMLGPRGNCVYTMGKVKPAT